MIKPYYSFINFVLLKIILFQECFISKEESIACTMQEQNMQPDVACVSTSAEDTMYMFVNAMQQYSNVCQFLFSIAQGEHEDAYVHDRLLRLLSEGKYYFVVSDSNFGIMNGHLGAVKRHTKTSWHEHHVALGDFFKSRMTVENQWPRKGFETMDKMLFLVNYF